ncbi:NADH-quinone oxidoreductase subunit NuoG [Microbulbifer sp. VAAF005]|uniref:NADH-quinone oxidoreductase subunit NuoG n=1 Tax=Microbulbifer sp. VAAF005 TaxID=3034230 RepID=UPI0024AD625B|nr:NADH-quinone oxidoreductase subunit NuoG [Microbulbifer sp. VAAF005]WHI48453.1 NADH-quinone oxidoreductase subunit NuoG [Microbulbifer sp. VAAF005]
MPTITIDGNKYQVDGDQNLLTACLSLGLNVPYFCWHPAMGSVGACRQCAVIEHKDSEDQRGRLIMSCMTPIKDGGIYSVSSEAAKDFRGSVIEDLMTNHPHDCPVCEEGGECHLQDMTEMSGHTMRRYQGTKRTHRNQYLGPFINHEMNRCITCYRCVRFYHDYAGGEDLQALGRNHQVFFGRNTEGMLENGFSGNLVEVCPTGVFTDKTFSQHFVRKWDLQTAASVCEHCAVGCNTAPGARESGNNQDPMLRRVVNLYHHDINGYFLCDRGRFGYEYVNSKSRITQVLSARKDDVISSTAETDERLHKEVSPKDAVFSLSEKLASAQRDEHRLIGIGSPRASLENNFALLKFVGRDNFFSGLNQRDMQLLHLVDRIQSDANIHSPTIPEIENSDVVLILGEDIYNTAPRVALAVRQAARSRQKEQAESLRIPLWQDASVRQLEGDPSPIIFIGTELNQISDITCKAIYTLPEQAAQIGQAIANNILEVKSNKTSLSAENLEEAERISAILTAAKNPVIISGTSSKNIHLTHSAAKIACALAEKNGKPTSLYLCCEEANSLGVIQLFEPETGSLEHLITELKNDKTDIDKTLVILENDLSLRVASEELNSLFASVDHIILLDTLLNETAKHADLIFPVSATAESQGTFVNNTGLAQRFYAVYEGTGYIQESWRWLVDAAGFSTEHSESIDTIINWNHCPDITDSLAESVSSLKVIKDLGPDENFRIDGLKVARQTARYSGRTAIHAEEHVSEEPPHQDPDAPMSFSMEGVHNPNRSPLQANIWSPGWNSNQSIFKFQQEVGGERRGGASGKYIQRQEQVLSDWSLPTASDGDRDSDNHSLTTLPIYRMFGSEELSNRAMAIATVIDKPFFTLNRGDAESANLNQGDTVALDTNSGVFRGSVVISDSQPSGSLGVPYGLPGLETLAPVLPGGANLLPVEESSAIGQED